MARVKCLVCNEILESRSVHDFQQCDCENAAFIDGGDVNTRMGAKDLTKVAWADPERPIERRRFKAKNDTQKNTSLPPSA